MSKLRNAIEFAPEFVGVTGQNAKRWAEKYLDMFDKDVGKKSSTFDLQPSETIEERLDVLNGLLMAKGAERDKVVYFIELVTLAAYSCAVHKGRTDLAVDRDRLAGRLSTIEGRYTEMASVYSVADASTQTVWA